MTKQLTELIIVLMLAWAAGGLAASQQPAGDAQAKAVWIYRNKPTSNEKDTRSDSERLFAPYGFMPAERVDQIAVNASRLVDDTDPKKGTCVQYAFRFKDSDDWQGVFTLIGGDAWGTKPGINVQKLLLLKPEDSVLLRFLARGDKGGEVVTFQVGAVTNGKFKSSLQFPRTRRPDPTKLTAQWEDYEIKLQARELTNLIDPFCVVARAIDNRGKNTIQLYVDDVRLEAGR